MSDLTYALEQNSFLESEWVSSNFINDPTVLKVYAIVKENALAAFEAMELATEQVIAQIRKEERVFYTSEIIPNRYCFTFSIEGHYRQYYAVIDIEAKTFKLL